MKILRLLYITSLLVACFACSNNSETELALPKVYTDLGEIQGEKADPDSFQLPRVSPFNLPEGNFLKEPAIIKRKQKESKTYQLPAYTPLSSPKPIVAKNNEGFIQRAITTKPIAAKAPELIQLKSMERNGIETIFNFEGLNSFSTQMWQQKNGKLWFSSYWYGALCFDGKNLYNYNKSTGLPTSYVHDVFEDQNEEIWIANLQGMTRYNGSQFYNYSLEEGDQGATSILEDENGMIWFHSKEKLYRINKDHNQMLIFDPALLFQGKIQGIEKDQFGNIWFGVKDKGIAILCVNKEESQEFEFLLFTKDQGLLFERHDKPEFRYNFFNDRKGKMWFATNFGVFNFSNFSNDNFEQLNFQFFNKNNGLNQSQINTVLENEAGEIMLGHDSGIDRIKLIDSTSFAISKEGEGSKVKHLFKDLDSNIWINYRDQPISKKQEPLIKYLFNEFEYRTNIQALAEDAWGNIWIGTYGYGILCLRKGQNGESSQLVRYLPEHGLPSHYTDDLEIDKDGNLWVSYRNACISILKLSNEGKTVMHRKIGADQGVEAFFIPELLKDKAGNMWFSATPFTEKYEAGIFKYDGSNLKYYTDIHGLPSKTCRYINQDAQGNFWFNSNFKGLAKYKPSETGKGEWTYFRKEHGLPDNEVNDIFTDSFGNIWFRCQNDFYQLIPIPNSESYTLRQLKIKNVRSIFEDSDRNLWLQQKKELKIINYAELDKVNTNSSNITVDDGYSPGSRNTTIQSTDGNIWFSGNIFNPNELNFRKKIPSINLNEVLLFNERVNWKKDTTFHLSNGIKIKNAKYDRLKKWNLQPENLSLAYQNNFIGFSFSAIETTYPARVSYKHTLEGLQDYWNYSKSETKVNFAGLEPGDYTFKAMARVGDDEWSAPLLYPFTIRPPWYRTMLAYLIYGIILFSGLVYFIRTKIAAAIRGLKEIEAMRTKISSDLHDDVGTILAGAAMQAETMALKETGDTTELDELSDYIRTAMEKMRDIVWAMDSRKDKYENLIDKMVYFANSHLKDSQFSCQFEIKEIVQDANMKPDIRQNLYLMFKEAITNIRKHSNGDKVEVNLRKAKGKLIFSVKDNGSNLDIAKSEGLGLSNMKMRAEQMGAEFFINKVNGFEIGLILPNA